MLCRCLNGGPYPFCFVRVGKLPSMRARLLLGIRVQVKEEFVTDRDDMIQRNIMDGDPFLSESPSWRFRKPETEPYMPSQSAGAQAVRR
jgi:hypothetical protein